MIRIALLLPLVALCAGCRQDMFDQPKIRPLALSDFFIDGRSARPIPAGTLEYNRQDEGEAVESGTTNGKFVASIPLPVDEQVLHRGRERFDIYCSPCHARAGDGEGMIAKRGFLDPADLHTDRARKAPPGYIYAVIANGYGAMPDYRDQISVHDRWAVVAYIRALQLSRNATMDEVPADQRAVLEKKP